MSRLLKLLTALGIAAAAAYLIGKRGHGVAEAVKHKAEVAKEKVKAAARPGQPPPSDQALAAKVKSEIFRPDDAPKGKVNVDAADGLVTLRGQLEDAEEAEELEKAAGKIVGVNEVRNLIHQPGETPPNLEPVAGAGS